jgi:hypothetical protein
MHSANITPGESSYYSVKRISNSDLDLARHLVMGTPHYKPRAALRFGQALHEAVLEAHKFDLTHYPDVDAALLQKCIHSLHQYPCCARLLEGKREHEVYWTEYYTKIACKSKLDVLGTDTVIDLKTTNARTQAEFEQNALRFEYDRQLAFYADSVCARKMVLIGISKKVQKVFVLETTARSSFAEWGRAKYRFILLKIQQLNLFDQIWNLREA